MIAFPDPRTADENGIVFIGGTLDSSSLVSAYEKGIFPWPHEGLPLLWFSPDPRGLIEFKDFKIPRSVAKELKKKENFTVTFDAAFDDVVANCVAQKRRGQKPGTWITPAMRKAYSKLHEEGVAHSVECWNGRKLVGGLYGVCVKGAFSGESMFFKESGASKKCLIALVQRLSELGFTWMDTQMVTPVLSLFGAKMVPREVYLKKLAEAQKNNCPWKLNSGTLKA